MRLRLRRLTPWLKASAGIALLAISLRSVHWAALFRDILAADPAWLSLAVFSVVLGLALKVWRWEILLKGFGVSTSARRTAEAFLAGQAANIVLPARGGEVVRLGMIGSDQPSHIPHVAMTIGLEKALDLLALTGAAVAVAAYLPPQVDSRVRGWLLPASGMALGLVLFALIWGPKLWARFSGRLQGRARPWVTRLVAFVGRLAESSYWLRDPRKASPVLLLTLVIWATMWATNLLLFRALGLSLGGAAAGLVLVLVMLGLLPALMPGNVGPFYFFAELALAPFAVGVQPAAAFAILLHAIVTLPPLLAAGLLLTSSDRLLRTLKRSGPHPEIALPAKREP